MRIKLLFACLLGLIVSVPVIAATATISWTPPTQNTDATALTNLASYNVYRGDSAATLTKLTTVTAPAASYIDTTSAPGQYYAITAVNALGAESSKSAIVCYKCQPKPPTNPLVK